VGLFRESRDRLLTAETRIRPNTLRNVFATGSVSGQEAPTGGLVGETIIDSIDYTDARIFRTYAAGEVTSSFDAVGGFLGRFTIEEDRQIFASEEETTEFEESVEATELDRVIIDSYWDEKKSGQDADVGSLNAPLRETEMNDLLDITGLPTGDMQGETPTDTMSGLDFEAPWYTVPEGYPRLRGADPFLVSIVDTTAPVTVGEDLDVTVEIVNQHLEEEVIRPVELVVKGEIVDQVDVRLGPEATTDETLTWTTTDVDVDRYSLQVASGRNTDTAAVRVGCIPRRDAGRDTPEDLICGNVDDSGGRSRGDDREQGGENDRRDRGRGDDDNEDDSDRDQGR
jgi:hypothetical protein